MFPSTTSLSIFLLGVASVLAAPIPQDPTSSPIEFAIAAIDAALSLPSPSQTWNSTASWALQNGTLGACGLRSQDTDLVVSLPSVFYNSTSSNMTVSPYCGRYLVITSLQESTKSVTARIASSHSNGMSLSVAAWRALNGDATNLTDVNWRFATKNETEDAETLVVELAYINAMAVTVIAAASQPAATPVIVEASPVYTPEAVYTPAYTPVYTPVAVAPYTPPAAPAYTPPASNGRSGTATWYVQGGNAGACGSVSMDDAYIIAIPSSSFSTSLCGKSVSVKNTSTGKTITVQVADSCPTCGGWDVDLSKGAFSALASFDAGIAPVVWTIL